MPILNKHPRTTARLLAALGCLSLSAGAIGCNGSVASSAADPILDAPLATPIAGNVSTVTLRSLGVDQVVLGAQGTPAFLHGHVAAAVVDGATAAQATHDLLGAAYGLSGSDTLRARSASRDASGHLYVRLEQLHNNIPVLHREVAVQATPTGEILAVVGELWPNIHLSAQAEQLPGEEALQRALTQLPRTGRLWVHGDPKQTVFVPSPDEPTSPPVLAYTTVVEYLNEGGRQLEELVFAASDGKILGQYTHRHDALKRDVYDYQNKCLGAIPLPGVPGRAEGQPPTGDVVVNRIYDFTGVVFAYYKHMFGRDSYDNKGAKLTSSVHAKFSSGFSCVADNAAWLGSPYFQMAYGDGSGSPFVDLTKSFDVTAHELTHAVTSETSKLVYMNESGALNEGMSDIFGAAAEGWQQSGGSLMGNPAVLSSFESNWLIGEGVAPTLPGMALRFMKNPTFDGNSKDYYPERIMPGGVDRGGVHLNSGMPNLVFYLISEGGKHPRNKTATVVPGIGFEKAQRIFYLANSQLLIASSTFQQARFATAQAAETLYGRCSREWQAVHMAWDTVAAPGTWTLCLTPPGGF